MDEVGCYPFRGPEASSTLFHTLFEVADLRQFFSDSTFFIVPFSRFGGFVDRDVGSSKRSPWFAEGHSGLDTGLS